MQHGWITERGRCTMGLVFVDLLSAIKADVEEMNALLEQRQNDRYRYAIKENKDGSRATIFPRCIETGEDIGGRMVGDVSLVKKGSRAFRGQRILIETSKQVVSCTVKWGWDSERSVRFFLLGGQEASPAHISRKALEWMFFKGLEYEG